MATSVPAAPVGQTSRVRGYIFAYDLGAIAVLLLLVWWYFQDADWSLSNGIPAILRGLPVYTIWFGALGGIVISLKGVYDHGPNDWQDRFNLWHFGRPFSGAIAGGVTFLLLLAVSKSQPSAPIAMAAAVIMGTQEKRFFNFLYEVARLIVSVPGEDDAALMVSTVLPTQGAQGTRLTIAGQGFDAGVVVRVGDKRLADVNVNKDGTEITGVVPAGAGTVNILVINPDGAARSVDAAFTYQSVFPSSLNFSTQQVGTTSRVQTVTFTNTGTGQVTVTGATITLADPGNFQIVASHCTNVLLEVGANCTVDVVFAPQAPPGDKSATLTFTTSTGGPYAVPLTGTGTA